MSVEAISWALNLAPVPHDRGGRPSSACKFVLVGLANHAGPDGSGAFPSVATLVRYTSLSERTVRTCLDRLEAAGLIEPCDPDIVAARIKRADRQPQGWDLKLSQVRELPRDDGPDRDASARQALLGGRIRHVHDERMHGLRQVHNAAGPVDNSPDGVQQAHPATGTGCNQRAAGVQPVQSRGAAAAPEPYKEPSAEPPTDCESLGGVQTGEFFAALGGAWQLTAAQRNRLAPAVDSALGVGWTPARLAAATGANTVGVRNSYAVLAARLSPSELPGPPPDALRLPRPPWCGGCDQRTRRRENADGGDAGRCPVCHPRQHSTPSRQQ